MSLPVVFLREAEDDLAKAIGWYDVQGVTLGQDLLNAVRVVLNVISESPQLFPPGYRMLRRANLKKFPYTVVFRLESNRVLIVAIHHWKRHPRQWQGRS